MAFIRKMYIMFQLLHLVTWGILSPSIFKCLMVQTRRFILCQTAASYRLQAAGMRFVLCCKRLLYMEFWIPCPLSNVIWSHEECYTWRSLLFLCFMLTVLYCTRQLHHIDCSQQLWALFYEFECWTRSLYRVFLVPCPWANLMWR